MTVWQRIRVAWVSAGILATLALAASFQAHGFNGSVLSSSEKITVSRLHERISFLPRIPNPQVGLLFFPGGMVQPTAYSPLARRIAEEGYRVEIIKLPWLGRHAPNPKHRRTAVRRATQLMDSAQVPARWIISGHSLGGLVASELAYAQPPNIAALVLIGTSHPRDIDLTDAPFPVTKIFGSRDGVASPKKMRENAGRLPPKTQWIEIAGGNHSQFGYYGPQLGDRRALITRKAQQEQLANALLAALRAGAGQTR